MARKVIVTTTILDDFDNDVEAEETLEFTVDGIAYIVDLSTARAERFRKFVAPYQEAAHEKVKARTLVRGPDAMSRGSHRGAKLPRPQPRSPVGETPDDRRKIREWAANNGFDTQPRGLISQKIRYAYTAATGHAVPPNQNQILETGDQEAERLERVKIRKWAVENGYTINPNGGMIAKSVIDAYYEAVDDDEDAPTPEVITQDMRDWARANGHTVRGGYVTRKVRDEYYAAQEQA